tara:strand:- start:1726 stop:1899 length:174 start_codon:yes stop_codon:yes gene_type:complete
MDAQAKASKAKANRKYYLANKASLAKNRRIRYIKVEKPQAARKEFMKLLSDLCTDPI